jgi:hypothetical protein
MNRFDEVLIVNPGVPDAERTRPMYGYYAQTPEEAIGAYGDPHAGYGYAAYPDPNGYGYYGYGDPGLYAAPGYGFADAYGYAAADPYGYAAADPYGYGDAYGYGNVDPYAMGQVDPQVYGAPDPYGYGFYGYDDYAGYGQELPGYEGYGAADPYVYGVPEAAEAEVGTWSGVETPDGSSPAFFADAEPDFGAYTRDVNPAPFNAVCPIVGNVRFGAGDEFEGYVSPAPVGPTCGSFVPQPGTPPPVPDTFKPLW